MLTEVDIFEALRGAILEGALPESLVCAYIALTFGFLGLGVAVALSVAYLRDLWFVVHVPRRPEERTPPRLGPLHLSLGSFLQNPAAQSALSPDAAAEFVADRLENQHQAFHSLVRFFAYAPLLFGLMGTILALRGLLVDSGKTLQEIQPELAGVFSGTLAGIVGSLVSATGGLLLNAVVRRVNNSVQDFIHLQILPEIPERRIALRIEEAVLERIGEKAQAVVGKMEQALQPLAKSLRESAEGATAAAGAATNAFGIAARAVKEAGDLEKATRNFKAAAHMLDSSAESLTDATRQTAETLLRFEELQPAIGLVSERLEKSSAALTSVTTEMTGHVTSRIEEFVRHTAALRATVQKVADTFAHLSDLLAVRAQSDSAHVEAIRKQSDAAAQALAVVTESARETSVAISTLPHGFANANQALVGQIQAAVCEGLDDLNERLRQALVSLVPALEASSLALTKAAVSVREEAERSRVALPDFTAQVHDLCLHLERLGTRLKEAAGMATPRKQSLFVRLFRGQSR
jgi:hypothetical protein